MTTSAAPIPPRAGVVSQSVSMVLSTGINSGLGMVFWIVASRTYAAGEVGTASALISGVSLVLGVGQVGLPLALPRLLPVACGGARRLVATSYAVVLLVSLPAAGVFVFVAHRIESLATVFSSIPFSVWFVVSAPCYVIFAVQDFVLCGLYRARWTPLENLAYSVARFALLGLLVGLGASGVYLATTAPAVIAAGVVTWLVFMRVVVHDPDAPSPVHLDWRLVASMISSDYLGNVVQTASIRMLPLVIVAAVGGAPSAYFYVAWTVVFSVDTVVSNVVTAVTVDGADSRTRLAAHVTSTLSVGGPALLAIVGFVVVTAGPVLGLFAEEYRAATVCLRLLALSLVPRLVLLVAAAVARHDQRAGRIIAVQVVPAALTIVGATAVASRGIAAVATAYTVAQVAAATGAAMWLWRWLRRADRALEFV